MSSKYIVGILIGVVLNLKTKSGKTDFLTIFNLLIYEHNFMEQLSTYLVFFDTFFQRSVVFLKRTVSF